MTTKWLSKLTALALGTAVIASPAVWAGEIASDTAVVVDLVNGEAYGMLANADARQSIGCDIATGWDFENSQLTQSVSCRATDAFGATLGCTSTDPNFVRVARLLRSRGWLWFGIDPAAVATEPGSAICQSVTVEVSSTVLPDQLNQLP